MTSSFLQDYVPNFRMPAAGPSREKIVQREVFTKYLEVNCLETKSDTIGVQVPLQPGEELVTANATLEQTDNIRANEVKVINSEGTTVTVRYTIVGSSITIFGCKGGGHATLRIVVTIRQNVT